jgi:hypothetical protein
VRILAPEVPNEIREKQPLPTLSFLVHTVVFASIRHMKANPKKHWPKSKSEKKQRTRP